MKKLNQALLAGVVALLFSSQIAFSQGIAIHTYRHVAMENMEEYLKRETTYWQKFAESEIKKGNMYFWAVFQRVGGTHLGKAPNILIINGISDPDKGVDWSGISSLFPDVDMADMDTGGLFTTTDNIYVRDLPNHIQVENPQFNYVHILYHNVVNTNAHLDFEANEWKPMLQKAMNEGKTTLQGWGNGQIVSPESADFPYTAYSYDLFATLKDALGTYFSDDVDMADDFGSSVAGNEVGRMNYLYRIVAVAAMGGE